MRIRNLDTAERNRDIYQRIVNGESQTSIAALYGLSQQRVSAIARREHAKRIKEVGLIEASKNICC